MQEINLYQPVSKGVRGMLSAGSTAVVMAVMLATLLGFWGFAWWQVDKLEAALQVVQNQQAAQAAMSAAQGPQLDGLTDEELEALVAELTASTESKSLALAQLATEGAGGRHGFSARLRAFGARHIDGIWLERLTLGPTVESVSIQGSTLSPEAVPAYLRSLAADPALRGGQIDDFIIEKPTDKEGKPLLGTGRLSFRAGHKGLVLPVARNVADEAGETS